MATGPSQGQLLGVISTFVVTVETGPGKGPPEPGPGACGAQGPKKVGPTGARRPGTVTWQVST